MEAKATVMTHKQRVECSHNPVLELRERDMCEAQAEISFKAGIGEVAEWIERYKSDTDGYVHISFGSEWQIQLKKWGVHSGVS